MNLLTSFAPFLVSAVLIPLGFIEGGLWGGALTAAVLLLRDRLLLGRSIKILEVGTMVLFAGLGLYSAVTAYAWTIPEVRLVVDAGLLAIALASLAVGVPFTLQYARESTPAEVWSRPEFLAVNRRITLVWVGVFLVMVAADAAMVFVPAIPRRLDIIATVLVLVGAFKFTARATQPRSRMEAA